jgi:hypothetical protein
MHNADVADRHVQSRIHFGHIAFNQRRSSSCSGRNARPTNQPPRLQSRKYELSESIPASTAAFMADETIPQALSVLSSAGVPGFAT